MLELAIWSAASGAVALVILMCLVDLVLVRTVSAAQGAAYNLVALLFVLLLSGVAKAVVPESQADRLHLAQVLVGPLCVCLGDLWVRGWLGARHRDRLMNACLLTAGTLAPVATLLSLLVMSPQQQLGLSAVIVVVNTGLVVWMSVRAWLLGDALALGIAIGGALMMPSVAGLYAVALSVPGLTLGWHLAIATATVLCISIIGYMLWMRNQHERRVRGVELVQSQYDPVTKLPGGLPFVRKLLRAQKRRRRTNRDGAVIAVMVFAPERIVSQAGTAGLNEVYVHLAKRLQRQVGVVNPVGRYWERCFVVLVETIHSPAAMRTLGLRVASSLRRPMQVSGSEGHPVQVRLDIGVGVLHLGKESAEVEDLLHDAQQLAEAARGMQSRAATRDPGSHEIVPVEHARLGRQRAHGRPHAAREVLAGLRARA